MSGSGIRFSNRDTFIGMRLLKFAVLTASVSAALLAQAPQQGSTTLKVGDTPPDFTLPSIEKGVKVHLADYVGKSTVVLAFFPAAFTGG
jgi:AhpC/TSA family